MGKGGGSKRGNRFHSSQSFRSSAAISLALGSLCLQRQLLAFPFHRGCGPVSQVLNLSSPRPTVQPPGVSSKTLVWETLLLPWQCVRLTLHPARMVYHSRECLPNPATQQTLLCPSPVPHATGEAGPWHREADTVQAQTGHTIDTAPLGRCWLPRPASNLPTSWSSSLLILQWLNWEYLPHAKNLEVSRGSQERR